MARKLTTEEFIEKARELHGDRYDYSKVEYVGSHAKVEISCGEHGGFMQTPSNHTNKTNPRGCPRCGYELVGSVLRKGSDEFIAQSISLWGDRYCYSSVIYKSNDSHVTITCKEHGCTFEQLPYSHLEGKQGCPYCSSRNRGAGMVYLIEVHVPETDENFIKIGWTTSNVRTRFKDDRFEWKQLNRKMFPNAYLGERWERYMHKMFDDCRYKPKHSFVGETECFGYQYKELIQKTFAEEAKRGN